MLSVSASALGGRGYLCWGTNQSTIGCGVHCSPPPLPTAWRWAVRDKPPSYGSPCSCPFSWTACSLSVAERVCSDANPQLSPGVPSQSQRAPMIFFSAHFITHPLHPSAPSARSVEPLLLLRDPRIFSCFHLQHTSALTIVSGDSRPSIPQTFYKKREHFA